MATPKRARTTSSTPRSKKPAAKPAQESTALPQTQSNGYSLEAVRIRAYQLFEQRGRVHGYDAQDWLQAEAEIVTSPRHTA